MQPVPPTSTQPPDGSPQPSPMALALEWVSRILAAVLVMVGLGLGGQWLDRKFGTRYWVLVGFLIGLPVGLGYLIWITRRLQSGGKPPEKP